MWSYVREEASHGRVSYLNLIGGCVVFISSLLLFYTICIFPQLDEYVLTRMLKIGHKFVSMQKAPIDPFTRDICKPSASQGVPLGGMGYVGIRRFRNFFGLIFFI